MTVWGGGGYVVRELELVSLKLVNITITVSSSPFLSFRVTDSHQALRKSLLGLQVIYVLHTASVHTCTYVLHLASVHTYFT